jgi:hypothetical protein
MIEVINRSRLSGPALEVVQGVLSRFTRIEQVARFAETQVPPFQFAGCRSYDDHSHDIVVSRPSDRIVLVFDANCSGALARVTIWDRQPSTGDLSGERSARTASRNGSSATPCRFGGHAPLSAPGFAAASRLVAG